MASRCVTPGVVTVLRLLLPPLGRTSGFLSRGLVSTARAFASSSDLKVDNTMACPNLAKLSRAELTQVLGSEDLVNKLISAATSKGGRANHAGVPSTAPPDNPSRRVDVLDIEEVAQKVGCYMCTDCCHHCTSA